MNFKIVIKYISIALLFNSGFMFLSLIVSMIYGFDSSFYPLLISALLTFTAGIFPVIFVKNSGEGGINIKEGFTIIIFSWLLSCIFGMLPYIMWGGEFSLLNAWFESVSGYTTTGATILNDIEALPKGLLFWRSSTHYLGGIGVVIFMLLVLPTMSTFRFKITKMEISSLSKDNFMYRRNETVIVIAKVYAALTLLQIVALLLTGMNLFDAVNHSFSTVATGGFSTRNGSIAAYNSPAIEIVMSVFMLLGGLHFGMMYAFAVSKKNYLFKSPITKFYLGTLLVSIVIITFNLFFKGEYSDFLTSLRHGFFQAISYASTSGFSTTDSSAWPLVAILILMYLSIQCACSGSTAGGLKSDRIWIFIQSFKTQLRKQVHPNAVIPVKLGKQALEPDMVSTVNLHIVLYLAIIFIMMIIYAATGLDLMDSLSSSICAMGNIGIAFGSFGSQSSFDLMPIVGKIFFTLQMLLGRLEIYTLLLIFVLYKKRA